MSLYCVLRAYDNMDSFQFDITLDCVLFHVSDNKDPLDLHMISYPKRPVV